MVIWRKQVHAWSPRLYCATTASTSNVTANPPVHKIDFQCQFPFVDVPQLVEEGFETIHQLFANGDQRIMAHYDTAYKCLKRGLGDPLCDLLLMIVLTFANCSVTPTLPAAKSDFEVGSRKNPGHFAVALCTRMLWFLYPHCFPWGHDDGMVLSIREMVKKIGELFPPSKSFALITDEFRRAKGREQSYPV